MYLITTIRPYPLVITFAIRGAEKVQAGIDLQIKPTTAQVKAAKGGGGPAPGFNRLEGPRAYFSALLFMPVGHPVQDRAEGTPGGAWAEDLGNTREHCGLHYAKRMRVNYVEREWWRRVLAS